MHMQTIIGKDIADKMLLDLKKKIENSSSAPGLAVLLIGDDKASQIYVGLKEKAAQMVGVNFQKFLFDENSSEEEIIEKIEELNSDKNFNGIIVQLPLPEKFNTNKIINTISPKKDADGFRKESINKNPVFPTAILKMIESINIDIKNSVVVTKSERFGETMKGILKGKNIESDYIICNEIKERDLKEYGAIITACGIPNLISSNIVKDGSIIIDGGIKKEDGKIMGDVDVDSFKNTNCYISPVPGGVGPVTVACLLESVYNLSLSK